MPVRDSPLNHFVLIYKVLLDLEERAMKNLLISVVMLCILVPALQAQDIYQWFAVIPCDMAAALGRHISFSSVPQFPTNLDYITFNVAGWMSDLSVEFAWHRVRSNRNFPATGSVLLFYCWSR